MLCPMLIYAEELIFFIKCTYFQKLKEIVMIKKLTILLVFIAIIGGGYYYWKNTSKPVQPIKKEQVKSLPLISVGKVESIPFVLTEEYIGYVSAIKSVEVRPYISGFIEQVLVEGGQSVKKQDPMFLLKQDEYLADLEMKKAQIIQSFSAFENASSYYERTKKVQENTISEADADKAKAEFFQTAANLAAALAAYKSSKVMYDYTFVNAPIDGIVGNISITEGQYVAPDGESLAYLIQSNPIRVVFSIPDEKYLNLLMDNAKNPFFNRKIRLKLANGKMYDVVGKIEFCDNQVNSQTSSVQVWANFENPDNFLLQNAYVDVMIEENIENAILIPQRLVSLTPDGAFVWVVGKNGYLHQQKIKTEPNVIDNGFYLVSEGLSEGDFVVLNHDIQLTEQQKVQIKIDEMEMPEVFSRLLKEEK